MTESQRVSKSVARTAWRRDGITAGTRAVPEETAVALTYNGGTQAVMMATPADLEDFAVGFSLSEGIVSSHADIRSLDVIEQDGGVELRMWVDDALALRLSERRRQMAGPTGCGLCGVDSITAALRAPKSVEAQTAFTPAQVMAAMEAMAPLQALNMQTRAVHAAAFWTPARGIVCLREDVGRHNALDKLAGALAREGFEAAAGLVLLTSRVSVEMVQKATMMGAGVVVSVSAPTALALRMADEAGLTLAAIARADGFEIFTHPRRIAGLDTISKDNADVA